MFYFWDPTFFLLIPALLLGVYAQFRVKSAYSKYSSVKSKSFVTGKEVAYKLLRDNGIHDVEVRPVAGNLTDNYNPVEKTLNLSEGVFNSPSISAIGIAAHEAGHAIQHSRAYLPLSIRNGIFPVANLGSSAAFPLFFIGLLFSSPMLMEIGIWIFTGVVIFHLVTLPVEFNASSRAVALLREGNIVDSEDIDGVKKVLNAAALTYVAATLMAVMQLLRMLIMRGNRD